MEPQAETVINPQYQTDSQPKSGGKVTKRNMFKLIIGVFVVLLVAEVIWAVYSLQNTNTVVDEFVQTANPPAVTQAKAAVSLKGPAEAKVGETIKVDISLMASEPTDGADVIIKYDPTLLAVQPVASSAATTTNLYGEYPSNKADAKAGVINLSGLTGLNKTGFSGTGTLGTIIFKTLKAGQATLSFDYTKGASADSNVIGTLSNKDILETVENLTINIK